MVPRGRRVLDRRVRDLRHADGRLEGPRPPTAARREGRSARAAGRGLGPAVRHRALRGRQHAPDPRPLPRPRPPEGRFLRSRPGPPAFPRVGPCRAPYSARMADLPALEGLIHNRGPIADPAAFARDNKAESWLYLCGTEFASMDGGMSYEQVQDAVGT